MDERIEKWCYDIKMAISEIDSFLAELKSNSFEEYQSNLLLKRAIEREFEIIGEAIHRIIKQDPSFSTTIPEAKSIIGLRNQIIHAYDNISDENIWSILVNHLPILKQQIDDIIGSSSPPLR
ncbi:MAG: DUF86 domain-containing protein [Saprospiraceae bacterium]|uniref:DUF86 domain-containing protein n=1 Tax=Candidatus Opimibacter skivensis TaxID=2982028 RepID=A0A9D7SUJ4_9BACT|nr:DUF86 domain-containing protein [Candidatus Opimibacter skivensis]